MVITRASSHDYDDCKENRMGSGSVVDEGTDVGGAYNGGTDVGGTYNEGTDVGGAYNEGTDVNRCT